MVSRGIAMAAGALLCASGAHAGSVVIDNTAPNPEFPGIQPVGPAYQITNANGKTVGKNLLVSFSRFDVDAGESVTFSPSQPVTNVIARVTGGTASHINGTIISQIPDGQLFLINPSGILIGAGARFEVQGALHLSTAQQLEFADGTKLDTRGGANPTLSSADPAAFGFLAAPKPITSTDAVFTFPTDDVARVRNTFSLTASDLTLVGTQFNAPGATVALHASAPNGRVTVPTLASAGTSSAPGGSVTLRGSAASQSTIDAQEGGLIGITGGTIVLNNALLNANVGSTPGQSVTIRGESVTLTSSSSLFASSEGAVPAASIELTGTRDLVMEEGSKAVSNLSDDRATARPIRINGGAVTIQRGAFVQGATSTAANGPGIVVNASSLLIDGGAVDPANPDAERPFTGLQTETSSDLPGAGRGGDITIDAGTLTILREAEVFARTIGAGRAGDVLITGDNMTVDAADLGFTGIESRVGIGSSGGAGGVIDIALTGDLLIRKGGAISATTFGLGTGGDVRIEAQNVFATEVGLGNIDAVTGEPFNGVFSRSNRRDAQGNPLPGGPAGTIDILAREQILVDRGSTIGTQSGAGGGNITLSAPTVIVTNGSDINTNAAGDGGTLTIAPAQVVVLGSGSTINAIANGLPVKTQIDLSATFIKSPDSQINADNPVLPPELDVTAGLITFNVSFIDISRQLQPDCFSKTFENVSTFTLEPRGGVRE